VARPSTISEMETEMTITEAPVTWKELAALGGDFTQFVQWIVQTHGPLPDGNIQQADYERYKQLYEAKT